MQSAGDLVMCLVDFNELSTRHIDGFNVVMVDMVWVKEIQKEEC